LKPPRHVVVCGGVMGASVGYFLALLGVAVTLVERRIDRTRHSFTKQPYRGP
jgi:glycine/D-amino acid oxidase-like deaminating enzyme